MLKKAVLVLAICVFSEHTCHAFDPMTFNPSKVIRDIEDVVEGFAKYLWATGMSVQCSTAIHYTIRSFFRLEPWSVALVDSLAKMPPGLMMGTVNSIGHYDECLQVYTALDNETSPFKSHHFDHIAGRYCSVKMVFDGEYWLRRFSNTSSSMNNLTRSLIRYAVKDDIYLLYEMNRMVDELPGFIGVCVPSQCSSKDMGKFFGFLSPMLRAFLKIAVTFEVDSCKTWQDIREAEMPLQGKIFTAAITVLVTICAIATLTNHTRTVVSRSAASFVRCFSLRPNTQSLVNADDNDPLLHALHGLRGISVLWFIIGNFVYLHSIMLTENVLLLKDKIKDVAACFVWNYSLSEDTIIFLTAVFMSLALQRRKPDTRSIFAFILHTIIRVWPLGLFWMAFVVLVLPYLGHGPTWSFEMKRFTNSCGESWWRNALLITNFWPKKTQCVGQLWFLSFIVQCSVIGVAFLAILFSEIMIFNDFGPIRLWVYENARLGKMILFDSILATALVTAVLTLVYDSGPTLLLREFRTGSRHDYFDRIYTKVYTRGGVFFIGCWFGAFVSDCHGYKMSKSKTIIGWILSLLIALGLIHSTYFWNQGKFLPGSAEAAIFSSVHRLLWTVPLMFVVTSCVREKAGVVLWILSWRIWRLSSRLVYCILLSHAYVIIYSNAVTRSPFFLSYDYLSYLALHHVALTIAVSFILSLLVERPLLALLKLTQSPKETDEVVVAVIDMKPTPDPSLLLDINMSPLAQSKTSFELK